MTDNTKHTPGPWSFEEAVEWEPGMKITDEQGAWIYGPKEPDERNYPVVVSGGAQDEQGGAVGVLRNADARLISAAPDLLKALMILADPDNWTEVETGGHFPNSSLAWSGDGDPTHIARNAIQKAIHPLQLVSQQSKSDRYSRKETMTDTNQPAQQQPVEPEEDTYEGYLETWDIEHGDAETFRGSIRVYGNIYTSTVKKLTKPEWEEMYSTWKRLSSAVDELLNGKDDSFGDLSAQEAARLDTLFNRLATIEVRLLF